MSHIKEIGSTVMCWFTLLIQSADLDGVLVAHLYECLGIMGLAVWWHTYLYNGGGCSSNGEGLV